MKRLCAQHGMVEVVIDGTCAVCGAPTIDPALPENKAEIQRARRTRTKARALEVVAWFMAVSVAFGPLVLTRFTNNQDLIAFAPIGIILAVLVVAALVALRHAPSVPGAWRLSLTSATVISVAICLAFVAIKRSVGIERLWFGRGYFGEPWRIVTASFTHGGAFHIGGNMLALVMFGPSIDLRVGPSRTWIVLAAGAIGGALLQAATSDAPMVGYSAAIYGLFGATLALTPTSPRLLSLGGIAIPLPTWAWMVVTVPLYTLIALSDPVSRVAWIAHLGGFAAGLLVALPMRRVPESAEWVASEEAKRERLAAQARRSIVGDLDLPDTSVATGDANESEMDADARAFHRATQRRQFLASLLGGAALIAVGLAAAALAAWLPAPTSEHARKVGTIAAGIVMTLLGGGMVRQAYRIARAAKRSRPPT